jgi:hypothetical protein
MTEYPKWKPKIGQKYYHCRNSHVGSGIFESIWSGSDLDESYWQNGNCFKSKKEAKFFFTLF